MFYYTCSKNKRSQIKLSLEVVKKLTSNFCFLESYLILIQVSAYLECTLNDRARNIGAAL